MEQIITLDTNDDVASVRSKLRALKPGPVVLVIPADNRALRGPIAMRVLQRESVDLALNMAIVSESSAIRHSAQQEGFHVYGSIESYRSNWPKRHPATAKVSPGSPRSFSLIGRGAGPTALMALVATVTVIALASLYVLLPSTSVVLIPISQKVQERLEITADPDAKTVDVDKRVVPARVVYVRSLGSEQTKATGNKSSNDAKAVGQISLTNRTQNEVTVPGGTIARTDKGIRFSVVQDTKLPAGGQSVARANIVAVDPGSSGNVSRGEISRLEGALDVQVGVFNEQPTTGGGTINVETVTEQDRTNVKETLQSKLEADVLKKLEAERQQQEMLSPESIRVVPLREDYDKDVGQESKVVNLDMELRANGTFYNQADVQSIVNAWSPRLKAGYYLRPETIKASAPKVIQADNGAVMIGVDIEGVVTSRINEDRVRDAIRWKTTDEAKQWLSNQLVLARDPEITVNPGWASRAFRIEVIVVNSDVNGGS